ncbi:MAG: replicative DNA helicase, partial [Chloroflexi bacterium]|nr:replicative DNA helicase [Chloroflexota bacterium]
MTIERQLPHNLDAEQAVLGSVLIDPDAIHKVMSLLSGDDFFSERHRWIWEASLAVTERRQPVDYVALVDELERQNKLDEIGGSGYVASLINSVPTAAHIETYAKIVERAATLRNLIRAATEIAGLAYADEGELDEIIDQSEQAIFAVSQRKLQRELIPIGQYLGTVSANVDYMQAHHGEFVGVPTGFKELDKLLGGLQSSDLIIVAGRPSVGKTSFVLNIVEYAASHLPRKTVATFSLEMAGEQIVQRLIANMTGIDGQRLRLGNITDDEYDRMMEAIGRLSEAPIYIDDTPAASPNEIRSKSRRLYAERGLDLIVIDYLQLMRGSARNENRVQEIAQISRALKALARELKVPVIALSQLSRAVESRPDKTPQLSDLRESGSIEQDA